MIEEPFPADKSDWSGSCSAKHIFDLREKKFKLWHQLWIKGESFTLIRMHGRDELRRYALLILGF